jgi:hypothetical protein
LSYGPNIARLFAAQLSVGTPDYTLRKTACKGTGGSQTGALSKTGDFGWE